MGPEALIASIVLSTAVSVYGQQQARKSQQRVAEYNAAVARNNAVAAQEWANYNAEREREKDRYRRGKMLVNFLKSGITLEGTPGLVLEEQLIQDELDANAIQRQGESRARDFQNEATITLAESKASSQASNIASVGTVLTGVGKVAAVDRT